MFLVTIPGLNDWAISVERETNVSTFPATSARTTTESCVPKRPHDEGDEDDAMETEQNDEPPQKKIDSGLSTGALVGSTLSAEFLLNSPLPDRPSKACIVKVSLTRNQLKQLIFWTFFL